MEVCNQLQVERSEAAQATEHMMVKPSTKDFKNMMRGNLVKTFSIIISEMYASENIFGTNLSYLKGKIYQRNPVQASPSCMTSPKRVLELNKDVELGSNISIVNGIPFVVSVERTIKFATIENILHRTKNILLASLSKIVKMYKQNGTNVTIILMDRKFQCLREKITERSN